MGNSSSNSGGGGHGHEHGHHGHGHNKHGGGTRYPGYHPGYPHPNNVGYDDGWSHSLETPEQRNRMKRGYFPPRAYVGGMPSPQKVLPVGPCVNPNKLLKQTSNGAILHGGGTISGRKLTELELEIRKRSTVSCPANGDEMGVGGLSSGRSTPNLLMPRMGLSSSGNAIIAPSSSSSRSREYGSEPDLRDIGRKQVPDDHDPSGDDRSSSPLPNSFTLISESPAKKQIRSRKKSKAPPPPPTTQMQMQYHPIPHPNDPFLIPYQYQLQQNPQRQLLLTPVAPVPLPHHQMQQLQQMQQMQAQAQGHFIQEEKKRSRLFKTKAESRSAMNSPALRTTPTQTPLSTPKISNNELISRNGGGGNRIASTSPSHPIGHENSKNKSKAPNPNSAPLTAKSPKPAQIHQQNLATTSGGSQSQSQPVPKGGNNKNVQGMKGMDEKKTFYFGMDVGTFKQKNIKEHQQQGSMINDKQQVSGGASSGQNQISAAHVADLHKEISRRKMIQKLDNEQKDGQNSRSSSRNSARHLDQPQQQVNGHANKGFNKNNVANAHSSANRASESDSDGIHRRQDSGSFELNEKKVGNGIPKSHKKIRESSSDLSSSDLDVPLVVTRPTLPQKRPELPRFSPTAAWRAIDSPSRGSNNSGRSFDLEFSGGEGGGDGRLHRFTRPSAPPRISAERSGDSGISAGDAGSPANAIPLLEEDEIGCDPRVDYDFDDEFSSSSPPLVSNNAKSNKNKAGGPSRLISNSRGPPTNKHGETVIGPSSNIKGADRKMKCWTPEQDLDESSSDFDQDSDPILPPVPPKPGSGGVRKTSASLSSSVTGKHCNLFEGKRASAVVSDSDSKYFGGVRGGFSSTDELNHASPRRYGRSGQNKDQKQQKRFFSPRYRSPGFPASPSSSSHYKHQPGYVGLDTNWFLSRSEPNSLNFLGIEDSGGANFSQKFAPTKPKKVSTGKEVIVGRSRKTNNNNIHKKHFPSEDELECKLQLDEEFDSLSSSDPTTGGGRVSHRNKAITGASASNKKNNNLVPGNGAKKNKAQKHNPSSEIGYGPSAMNFNNSTSSSAYEDQEEELEMRDEEEEEEEELMRDDLFDYLDQYEEGEFEREQELTTNLDGPFPTSGTTSSNVPPSNNNVITINHRNNNDTEEGSSRPFSHHIMYLPSYDSRKIFNQKAAASWRRTRSVDALDGGPIESQKLFKRDPSPPTMGRERIHHIEVEGRGESREGRDPSRKSSAPSYLQNQKSKPSPHHVSNVTITSAPLDVPFTPEEEERRAFNKKKFKFQSTLRVQERRKIEAELSREAEHAEEERLREIEEMKRVEEEFQKKRRAKAEAEARAKQEQELYPKKFSVSNSNSRKTSSPPNQVEINTRVSGKGQQREYNHHSRMMSQRQEPEGAPASVTVSSLCNSSASNGSTDLRKELISASKKRSGNPVGGGHNNQTQELSEYRQETRQYCDYRRGNRQQSLSPARFIQKSSSSSDIFPIPSRRRGGGGSHSSKVSGSGRSSTTTIAATVHPEVVCDIPVKPHPYMVNASRLSGSTNAMHLVSEERPNSVMGSGQNLHLISGPSSPSVVSGDNYRRDWAHHLMTRGGGGSGVGGSGRASSVLSLHSAPPTTTSPSDNFRNSSSDLSRLNSNASPGFGRHRNAAQQQNRQNHTHMIPNYRQYSASPPPSRSPVPSSTATDSFRQMSETSPSSRTSPTRILSSKTNTTVISIGRGPQMMKRPSKKNSMSSSSSPSPINASSSPNSNSFQAQPYSNNNRTRGYRPVAFKPTPQSQAAVN